MSNLGLLYIDPCIHATKDASILDFVPIIMIMIMVENFSVQNFTSNFIISITVLYLFCTEFITSTFYISNIYDPFGSMEYRGTIWRNH